jgi:hypothetical protein
MADKPIGNRRLQSDIRGVRKRLRRMTMASSTAEAQHG